ncbi:MAG: M12 family metallo-peptidase [bacterium]
MRPLYLLLSALLFTTGCEEISAFIESVSDGSSCETNAQCFGGKCLTPDLGFTGGYCTTLNCETDGCFGFGSECFRTELAGKNVTACYELCNYDGTCDRAAEGYTCVQLDDSAVCLTPTATNAPVQGSTGSACATNAQCNGNNATCLTTFFGGYCSQLECTSDADCLGGNPCVLLNPDAAEADQRTACLQACDPTADTCRYNYSCQAVSDTVNVCLEGESSGPRNPDGADDGQACVANLNCKGNTCIRENQEEGGQTSYPGGYCTTRDCTTDADCNGGICITRTRSTACFDACNDNSDCRTGYECRDVQEGRVCDSVVEAVAPPTTSDSAFDVVCGNDKTLRFTLPANTIGFYIAPFAKDGSKVTPQVLTYPNGSTLNIPNDYSFLAINPEILGSLAPILFPASDATNFKNAFGPGDYTLTVSTSASELCYYVIPKTSPGTTLDINLYFVGTSVTASAAQSNNNVRQVVDVVKRIYASMGVTANVSNYFDATETVSAKYGILRDFNDVYNLVATSTPPGTTPAENLSVNVFLIEDFNISEAPGLLGVSTGIPGMAGLHGSSGSGLVFSTASLGSDNTQLGQTMAHEIGHFLGLRHTTEHYGSAHDPISDTPECFAPDLAFLCGDSSNFMFAYALGGDQSKTTAGQAFVIKRSPLVQ